MKYTVYLQAWAGTEVSVEAGSPQEAAERVYGQPLPALCGRCSQRILLTPWDADLTPCEADDDISEIGGTG